MRIPVGVYEMDFFKDNEIMTSQYWYLIAWGLIKGFLNINFVDHFYYNLLPINKGWYNNIICWFFFSTILIIKINVVSNTSLEYNYNIDIINLDTLVSDKIKITTQTILTL